MTDLPRGFYFFFACVPFAAVCIGLGGPLWFAVVLLAIQIVCGVIMFTGDIKGWWY